MIKTDGMLEDVKNALAAVREKKPLVHAIVGQVSVNDCANVVLALGARPITAECPLEVRQIAANADSLAVSFANITESRAEAIVMAGEVARTKGIPSVIDVVGVTCSDYRVKLAKKFIMECKPTVVKGNISEIKVLASVMESLDDSVNKFAGAQQGNIGIDASSDDTLAMSDDEKLEALGEMVRVFAKSVGAVVLASGVTDIVTDGERIAYVRGGKPQMAQVTGTGCMLNCAVATMLTVCDAGPVENTFSGMEAAVCASKIMKRSGERADESKGLGSYRVHIIDEISRCD